MFAYVPCFPPNITTAVSPSLHRFHDGLRLIPYKVIIDIHYNDERFKGFLARRRGVASKYLNHYLAWHGILDQTQQLEEPVIIKSIFLQALAKPMKTNGKLLSAYCAEQLQKLGG